MLTHAHAWRAIAVLVSITFSLELVCVYNVVRVSICEYANVMVYEFEHCMPLL